MGIITISRGSLSGGKAVAECLARRLGYTRLDREVLVEAAEQLGIPVDRLQGKFESTPGLWARLTNEREKYMLAVQTALAEWCTRGDLVYHGIAGQFLLRELPGVLRVLILAPKEMRIKALGAAHRRLSTSELEDFIEKVDDARRRWVRTMYGEDVMDSLNYDLILNLRVMSPESACETIAKAAEQSQFQISADVESDIFAFAADCRMRLKRALGE